MGTAKKKVTEKEGKTRDPRIPAVDTVLIGTHKGVKHKCTVLAEGFRYKDKVYRSISKVASVCIGDKPASGYVFFKLNGASARSRRQKNLPPQPAAAKPKPTAKATVKPGPSRSVRKRLKSVKPAAALPATSEK